MHSLLFSIGPLSIHTYGLCMAIGYLLSWLVADRLSKKCGRSPELLSALITWIMIAAIVGARIAYVWEHWESEFAMNPLSVLRVDQGGLMFYGGFIGAAFTMFLFAKIYKQKVLSLTDLILTVLPLGHALGRIGCFFHGCCYGRLTNSAIGVCFPAESPAWFEQCKANLITPAATQSLPVLPSQLFEAAANAILFFVLLWLFPKKEKETGFLTGLYLIAYAFIRFAGEYLRGDPRMEIGFLSIGQTISGGLFLLGIGLLFFARRKSVNTGSDKAEIENR